MNVTIERHHYNVDEIKNQIRQHILPGLNLDIEQIVNDILQHIQPPPAVLADKSIHQINDALAHFATQAAKNLTHDVKVLLISMLEDTLDLPDAHMTHEHQFNHQHQAAASDSSKELGTLLAEHAHEPSKKSPAQLAERAHMQLSTAEQAPEPVPAQVAQQEHTEQSFAEHTRVQPANTEQAIDALSGNCLQPITDEPPELPPAEPIPHNMPLCTIRAIIIDRVDDMMIHDILTMHKAKMTPEEIRNSGIALTEEIIETIINDYGKRPRKESKESEPTDVEPDTSTLTPDQMHQARKLFKTGHTLESIAAETRISVDLVEEMTQDIGIDDYIINNFSLHIVQAHQNRDMNAEQIADELMLRPEYVAAVLNETA